jgi:hypothetical protein
LEIVALPDGVFFESDVETAVLLCKSPGSGTTSRISYIQIGESDRKRFLNEYDYPVLEKETKTIAEATRSLKIIALGDVWRHTVEYPNLGNASTAIHRGIEYQSTRNDRRLFAQKYIRPADHEEPGFSLGYHTARDLQSFRRAELVRLSVKPEDLRGEAINYAWNQAKVVMNASRVSRGPWCVAAFFDEDGYVCYQNFTAIWPAGDWTSKSMTAILNGPVASAFVAAREDKIHIRIRDIIKRIPLPLFTRQEIGHLDSLVDEYLAIDPLSRGLQAKEALLEIDAFILKGYSLPPRLERAVLDFFNGHSRPVTHDFGEYFPRTFGPTIPLWMYISYDFGRYNARHFIENIPNIDDPDLMEALSDVE